MAIRYISAVRLPTWYYIFVTTIIMGLTTLTHGQTDLLAKKQQLVEDFIESLDDDVSFDFNTVFEDLQQYFDNPLNLNTATEQELTDLIILNQLEINQILTHRDQFGDFISIYELQAIQSLDQRKILLLSQCLTVNESEYDFYMPISKMARNGRHNLFLKWVETLEQQDGYILNEDGTTDYQGDNSRRYLRYRYNFLNRMAWGVTAEKDAGEEFFTGSNPNGFDFYSAHIHLRDYNRLIKDVVIGDYNVSFGQGLMVHNSFGIGKSSLVMNVKKTGRVIRPYSSVNEFNFFRGAAATIRLSDRVQATAFASSKKIDGNINNLLDTIMNDEDNLAFSSFGITGLHRTRREIEIENSIEQRTAGTSIRYQSRKLRIGANAVYHRFDKEFIPNERLYNQFDFRGQSLLNTGLDYSYRINNFTLFGEYARSSTGGDAQLHGLLLAVDDKLDLSLVYRDYDRDYHSFQSNSFGETVGTQNEQGIYLGLALRPFKNIRVTAYADVWRHPWLRFRQNAPSNGNEYFLRIEYFRRRNLSAYVQLRVEEKDQNDRRENPAFRILDRTRILKMRLHLSKRINSQLEWRTRLELSKYTDSQDVFNGFLLYQDLLYRPARSPWSFSGRYSVFDVEDFLARIFTFENDILFEYFIPSFQNRGRRFYVNTAYDLTYNVRCELRFEQTYLDDVNEVGSGNEKSIGNTRTRIKAQIRFRF